MEVNICMIGLLEVYICMTNTTYRDLRRCWYDRPVGIFTCRTTRGVLGVYDYMIRLKDCFDYMRE